MSGITFGTLPGNDWRELKEFHNLLFQHTDASSQWFDWYMNSIGGRNGKNHQTQVYCVRHDDKLIGTWCVEAKELVLPGTINIVGRCFAVGIHPEFRRQNLFVELSKFALESERKLARYDHILGFPQVGRPVIGGHLKAGWQYVQNIDVWDCHPSKEDVTSLRSVNVVDDFWRIDSPAYRGAFFETPGYRNMRWLAHPDCNYVCLSLNNSYVVLKPYAGMCHLLDINGTKSEDVQALLRAAKTLAHRHRWSRLTTWCAPNEFHKSDFEVCGFAPTDESVTLLSVPIRGADTLQLNLCHLMMGSEEMY